MVSTSTQLPLDIIESILLKLPVKSLSRFKSVCKSWNVIISDHQFTKIHHKLSKPQNLFLIRSNNSYTEFCVVKLENDKLQVKSVLQNPFSESSYVLCSADGLQLLAKPSKQFLKRIGKPCDDDNDCGRRVFMLWNPSCRKKSTILCPYTGFCHADIGLCHDPNYLDDYKIVLISRKRYTVFSCKDKKWTNTRKFNYNIYRYDVKAAAFADGFTFWGCKNEHGSRGIIYFDPRDDKFKMLHKPPELLESTERFYLTSLGGRLCLYDKMHSIGNVLRLRIWMMELGHHFVDNNDLCNWSDVMVIEATLPTSLSIASRISPIFLTEKNEIVMLIGMECPQHLVYSPLRKTVEFYPISGPRDFLFWDIAIRRNTYVESLFFPLQGDSRPKKKRTRLNLMDL